MVSEYDFRAWNVNDYCSLSVAGPGEALYNCTEGRYHICDNIGYLCSALALRGANSKERQEHTTTWVWQPNMTHEHICPMFYMCLPVQSGYTAFSEILVSILMGILALDFSLFP